MADKSDIGWTDATWQIITGCSVDTPGCKICYAMDLAGTRLKNHPSRVGLTRVVNGKHVWTGEVRFNRGWLFQPLQWKKPRLIFVAAHGDLFHPNVRDEWLDLIFAAMLLAHWHTFQILTKRSARMRAYLQALTLDRIQRAAQDFPATEAVPWKFPFPNVHIGVSVEDQKRADLRMPDLVATPAAKRFVSAEPLLGPVDLTRWLPFVNQVITGGESGRGKRRPRPTHVNNFRAIAQQCELHGTAFFHKQNGSFLHESQFRYVDGPLGANEFHEWPDGTKSFLVGTKAAGNLLDGVVHEGRP